jgi:hypothetical protein
LLAPVLVDISEVDHHLLSRNQGCIFFYNPGGGENQRVLRPWKKIKEEKKSKKDDIFLENYIKKFL